MDVILLEKVANLGTIGDRVKVKSGYARTFLVPTGRATLATAANIAKFEAQRAVLEAKANEELKSAQERALKFENFKLELKAKAGTDDPIPIKEVRTDLFEQMERLKVSRELAQRYLNDGFSGGEKKRVEILQMAMLKPRLAVLDETDSGLDIDALKVVAGGV